LNSEQTQREETEFSEQTKALLESITGAECALYLPRIEFPWEPKIFSGNTRKWEIYASKDSPIWGIDETKDRINVSTDLFYDEKAIVSKTIYDKQLASSTREEMTALQILRLTNEVRPTTQLINKKAQEIAQEISAQLGIEIKAVVEYPGAYFSSHIEATGLRSEEKLSQLRIHTEALIQAWNRLMENEEAKKLHALKDQMKMTQRDWTLARAIKDLLQRKFHHKCGINSKGAPETYKISLVATNKPIMTVEFLPGGKVKLWGGLVYDIHEAMEYHGLEKSLRRRYKDSEERYQRWKKFRETTAETLDLQGLEGWRRYEDIAPWIIQDIKRLERIARRTAKQTQTNTWLKTTHHWLRFMADLNVQGTNVERAVSRIEQAASALEEAYNKALTTKSIQQVVKYAKRKQYRRQRASSKKNQS